MKYLKVFTNFRENIEELSDAEIGRLFKAMLDYAEQETIPEFKGNERFVWGAARRNIDAQRESYEKMCATNKKIATERYESSRSVTERYEALQDKDKDKDKEKDKDKIKEKNNKKRKYGEYNHVLLSDDEIEKLKEQFSDWEDRIRRLDEYIEQKGAKYKNHYLTILTWARKDEPQTKRVQKTYETSDLERFINKFDDEDDFYE